MPENKHQSCANCNNLGRKSAFSWEWNLNHPFCKAGEWDGLENTEDTTELYEPIKCVFWTENQETECEF